MTFTLRIDLESDKGIKAISKFLDLAKKYDIKASFYVTMGGEPNILDILKYRGKLKSAGERKIKIWSFKEKLRILLFPRDFVTRNKKILQRVIEEGHDLGIHGWKHRAWTRGLDKINIGKHLNLAIRKYYKIFRKKPKSFCAPTFNTNTKIVDLLEQRGIMVVSDFPGNNITTIQNTNVENIPITIKGENNEPIIEYLVSRGKKDDEILEYLKKEIKEKKLASMYIHGMYECIRKLQLIEEVFKYVKESKIQNKTIEDLGK